MIEGADINDKDILDNTRQERADNGTIRFRYKMPTGTDLVSEWFTVDNQRKAMKVWLDTVREQCAAAAMDKAREKGRESREKAAREARDRLMQMDKVIEEPMTTEAFREKIVDEVQRKIPVPAVDKVEDPCDHAKNQVALLEAEERHWLAEYQRAEKHLATARDKLRKWKRIVASLDAEEDK